ncbi:MAG TPA: MFS transporter, partial [Roseiflexaceae bacterium]|nr:MFS transporter [Roseiflexaceae bacterium]
MLPSDMTIHNRYRVIYIVDERPASTVYRGRDEQSGRLVLIAALDAHGRSRADIALLARQAAATQHESLLPVVEHFEEGDTYYVVCDDIGGQDLERTLRARGGPLPEESTLQQARRLLDILEHLHSQKVPLNLGEPQAGDVWIDEDGVWHITPFTLIRPISHAPSAYRARELDLPNGEPNAASDLYALSALLYHALTGWAPPTAAQREAGTPLNGPRALNPNLSTLIEQVLLRGLQIKPENRYQSAREMRMSLEMVGIMDGRSLGLGQDALPAAQAPTPPVAPVPQPTGPYVQPPSQGYLPQPGMYSPPASQPAAYQPAPGQPYPPGVYQAQQPRRGISTGYLIAVAVVLTLALRPIGAFIFGRAADRYGRRPILAAVILTYSALAFISGFSTSLTMLLVLRALFGIAMGGEWGVGASLAMETIPPKARGIVSGILQAGYPTGYLVSSVVYGLLYQYIGWRGMFMIGIAPAFLAFFILRNVKESPSWTPKPALGADSIATLTAYGRLIIYAALLWLGASLYGQQPIITAVCIAVPLVASLYFAS